MDQRTKMLVIIIAVIGGAYVSYATVYPRFIEPLVKIDDEISKYKKDSDKLDKKVDDIKQAKKDYIDFLKRVGSIDPKEVQNEMKVVFDNLIIKHQLQNANVLSPRKITLDRKTKINKMTFVISGDAKLEKIVSLMKDLSARPELLRVKNPKITKASTSSRNKDDDTMAFRASVELWVLPDRKETGKKFNKEKFEKPIENVRYVLGDYSPLYNPNPFMPYKKPKTVIAKNTKPKNKKPDPKPVKEPEEKKDPPPPPPPPLPEQERWDNGNEIVLTLTMLVDGGDVDMGETMLHNKKDKTRGFVRVGEEFDGGKLLFVHQRGVLVGREDGRYVYPIGKPLSNAIRVDQAEKYKELQLVSARIPVTELESDPSSGAGEVFAAVKTTAGRKGKSKTKKSSAKKSSKRNSKNKGRNSKSTSSRSKKSKNNSKGNSKNKSSSKNPRKTRSRTASKKPVPRSKMLMQKNDKKSSDTVQAFAERIEEEMREIKENEMLSDDEKEEQIAELRKKLDTLIERNRKR